MKNIKKIGKYRYMLRNTKFSILNATVVNTMKR
jgi:hypothetical protein